jgi:hypothetical protein
MRPPSVLAVFVLLASFAGDAQEVLVRNKPDPSLPPLGVRLRMSVVNVDLLCKQGNGRTVENGTGFVVTYPDARLPKNSTFDYLVTNRHVAECWEEPAHRPRP